MDDYKYDLDELMELCWVIEYKHTGGKRTFRILVTGGIDDAYKVAKEIENNSNYRDEHIVTAIKSASMDNSIYYLDKNSIF